MVRYLLLLLLGVVQVLVVQGCSQEDGRPVAMDQFAYADMVLTGGVIITVDDTVGEAQAVALHDHRILAVGDQAEIAEHIGPQTQVIELHGRAVVPGFIEGHGHFLSLGRALQVLDLRQARNYDEIVAKVAQAVDGAQPGEWIFGMGWHQDKWEQVSDTWVAGVPGNTELNRVAPDNPVYLTHASGHAAFANIQALQAAGVDETTADPPGGTIVRLASGEPTGLLRENAQDLVEAAIAAYQARMTTEQHRQQMLEQVRLAGEVALQQGVTSFHDAGASFATVDFFKSLEAQRQLPVRLYVMLRGATNAEMAARLPDYFMPAEDNDFLAVRSIKRQIDGALGAHGAWLLAPYADLPDSNGLVLEPVAEIEATARLAIQHGFQVNTHAIGTRANRETLDLYERIWREQKVTGKDLRWRIEHAQHIHPDDIPRFGALGVIAAIQGVHCTSDGPWIVTRLGSARTEQTSYRWRDLIDSGARINNGTDVPVEAINPIASYYASVARVMNNGEAFYPAQAMTRAEALKSYTLDNAYSAFEEDLKGSISVGKLADLVVLSQNILTIPVEQLADTQVDLTIVGGQVRYQRLLSQP
jgi:predicted amidohydrolase YtcJ